MDLTHTSLFFNVKNLNKKKIAVIFLLILLISLSSLTVVSDSEISYPLVEQTLDSSYVAGSIQKNFVGVSDSRESENKINSDYKIIENFTIWVPYDWCNPYYFWFRDTGEMSGELQDQPPILALNQDSIQQDSPEGPFEVGKFLISGDSKKIIKQDVPDDLEFHGTRFYAKTSQFEKSDLSRIEFIVSDDTREGKYILSFERREKGEYIRKDIGVNFENGILSLPEFLNQTNITLMIEDPAKDSLSSDTVSNNTEPSVSETTSVLEDIATEVPTPAPTKKPKDISDASNILQCEDRSTEPYSSEPYNWLTHTCCNGKVYPGANSWIQCGDMCYNSSIQFCENEEVKNLSVCGTKYQPIGAGCCNGKLFNPNVDFCNNGAIDSIIGPSMCKPGQKFCPRGMCCEQDEKCSSIGCIPKGFVLDN